MLCNQREISSPLSESQLQAVAKNLALNAKKKDVIALYGDLGAGKTVFSRAFIQAITGTTQDVPSPTFTLVQTYDVCKKEEELTVWHFDLYRLKDSEEVYEIGFEEALFDGISLIEWPERAGSLLPKNRLEITIKTVENALDKRVLELKAFGPKWEERKKELELCLNV